MANNVGIPPSGKQARDSQIIISTNLSAEQAVEDHFTKSLGGHVPSIQRERKLPEGYFSKPSSVSHSRNNSGDSSRYTMSPPAAFAPSGQGSVAAAVGSSALAMGIQHSRTVSSPATLSSHMTLPPAGPPYGAARLPPHGISAAARPQQKHRSMDNTLDVDNTPLPYGWERKFTESGQPFYINSLDKTTTWEDPRKTLSASSLPQAVVGAATNLGPLPPGWEEAVTANGEKYFINHNERTTSWYDPRLPEDVQKPMIMQRLLSQQQAQKQGQPPSCAIGSASAPMRFGHQNPLAASARGQLPPSGSGASRSMAGGSAMFSPMIQELNQERLRLQERTLEIRDQGLLDRLSPVHPLSPGHNVGTDAFLGVGAPAQYAGGPGAAPHYPSASTSDFHIRQESSDSGLGMPLGYPHTPDNYLGSSDIDLSFGNINLMDPAAIPMDVDTTNIPATLDNFGIAPNELDQYLNHH